MDPIGRQVSKNIFHHFTSGEIAREGGWPTCAEASAGAQAGFGCCPSAQLVWPAAAAAALLRPWAAGGRRREGYPEGWPRPRWSTGRVPVSGRRGSALPSELPPLPMGHAPAAARSRHECQSAINIQPTNRRLPNCSETFQKYIYKI